ncbi:MAG: hypothetical protein LLG14_13780 [Nocardiaceae bacterium]|nr:hypothetical protein [Nocardiaceae bacterium]
MTKLDVDAHTFYEAANRCFSVADELSSAMNAAVRDLSGTESMSGSYDLGLTWGKSYDKAARVSIDLGTSLVDALYNYGSVLSQSGFNYEVAEFDATIEGATPPEEPALPVAPKVSSTPVPSACGGHGTGLVDTFVGLVDEIGVPVPDGDTDKLRDAAKTWTALSATQLASLKDVADSFAAVISPDAEFVDEDLRELQSAIEDFNESCTDLARACCEYKDAIEELRETIRDILEELAIELAATAVISIAASFISVGTSVAAGAAKAAETVARFAKKIADAVRAWKIGKKLADGVRRIRDLTKARKTVERINQLFRRGAKKEESAAAAKAAAEHRQNLGYDPAIKKFRPGEADTGARVESELGVTLKRAPDDANYDWVDSTGKTYDAVGNFRAEYFEKEWPTLQEKIRQHLDKADLVPVDVSQFTDAQKAMVKSFIEQFEPRAFTVGG